MRARHTTRSFHAPTGFNVETVEYKNISFTVWDVGGQDKVQIGDLEVACGWKR